MFLAGVTCILVGGLNILVYIVLTRMVDRVGAQPIAPLSESGYLEARERTHKLNPWSMEGRRLRMLIRETERPGAANRLTNQWIFLSICFAIAGLLMCLLSILT